CNLVSDMVKKELKPDVCTAERVIRCLCEAGERERAKDLCKEIVGIGCIPRPSVIREVVEAFVKASCVDEAIGFTEEMVGHGCLPDDHTY
ncbi:hypothetical protein EV30_14970, partial [Staphylococcus aureus]